MDIRKLIILFFIYLVFSTSLIAQTEHEFKEHPDSIEYFAKVLTGKWKLIGYYKNDRFVDSLMWTSYSNKIEGQKVERIITDSGLVEKMYLNDSLISIDVPDGIELIDMSFDKNGKGWYQHYSDYIVNGDMQVLETCQPIPEIINRNGIYKIYFSEHFGDDSESGFKIKGDTLIILLESREEKYVRLKE